MRHTAISVKTPAGSGTARANSQRPWTMPKHAEEAPATFACRRLSWCAWDESPSFGSFMGRLR